MEGYLPHRIAVCITKFDHPDVFERARQAGLVTFRRDGRPQVTGKNAEILFGMICDGSFWNDPDREASSARFVRDELRRRFHPDRIQYFVTSSIGFRQRPVHDPAKRRWAASSFDPEDYVNFHELAAGEIRIRGPITPVNVLEPLLSLQPRISGTAQVRPRRAVPQVHLGQGWRRQA